MNSQVRNTLSLLTIGTALVLALVVAAPAVIPTAPIAAAQSGMQPTASANLTAARLAEDAVLATLSAEAPVVAGLAARFQDAVPAPAKAKPAHRKSSKSSRIRQSMAMPFFSFARG